MRNEERKLLDLFQSLAPEQQEIIMEFAAFLAARNPEHAPARDDPLPIERPREETVVMAIKRLTRTYPMLDRRRLMADTSRCVAEHALHGRRAEEVIDELEAVFARHYETKRNDE